MSAGITENSVALSLAELERLEQERVQQEQAEHARMREQRAREQREVETRRRAEEAARIAREQEERTRRTREEAIERARAEARERAAADVACIEADARIRLQADNAVRAHELNQLRVRRETGRRRRELLISAALALVVGLGGAFAHDATQRTAELQRAAADLRERERALTREGDDAKRAELQTLDRRYAALIARPLAREAEQARKTAEAARAAVIGSSPRREALLAFADALDALEGRLQTLEKLELLERRHADLAAWARTSGRAEAVEAARPAAVRAHSSAAGNAALTEYERALEGVAAALARRTGPSDSRRTPGPAPVTHPCDDHDPGCGIDGRPVF